MEASSVMERFPMSSKLNNYSPLLEYLFNLGRQTGDAWIAQNGDALGQRSTMDVQQLLPGAFGTTSELEYRRGSSSRRAWTFPQAPPSCDRDLARYSYVVLEKVMLSSVT